MLTNAEMEKRKGQFKEALSTAEPPPAAYTLETSWADVAEMMPPLTNT